MTVLRLTAPLTGWLGPLDEAPDAVFAEHMLGDGMAIDPLADEVRAPCAGVVIAVHAARHAVTLRADGGAELLIHVGLDTVALAGVGFVTHVADGERVATGTLLLTVDLDAVARRATSLITPIVLTNGETFEVVRRAPSQSVQAGDWLMDIAPRDRRPVAGKPSGAATTATVDVALEHGLPARPAAPQAVSAVEALLIDDARTVVGRWRIAPPAATIAAGARLRFDSSASGFAPTVTRVTLRFDAAH